MDRRARYRQIGPDGRMTWKPAATRDDERRIMATGTAEEQQAVRAREAAARAEMRTLSLMKKPDGPAFQEYNPQLNQSAASVSSTVASSSTGTTWMRQQQSHNQPTASLETSAYFPTSAHRDVFFSQEPSSSFALPYDAWAEAQRTKEKERAAAREARRIKHLQVEERRQRRDEKAAAAAGAGAGAGEGAGTPAASRGGMMGGPESSRTPHFPRYVGGPRVSLPATAPMIVAEDPKKHFQPSELLARRRARLGESI